MNRVLMKGKRFDQSARWPLLPAALITFALAMAAGCRNPAPGPGPQAPPPQADGPTSPLAPSDPEKPEPPVDRPDPTTPQGVP